ncbi:hypothetical protein CR513_15967, partial [Mucuna pruriens]
MPQQPILFYEVFDAWGLILLVVDYVSRWVEAVATKTNALISDQWSHFCNRVMSSLLEKYGVVHRVATKYHPRQMAKLKCLIGKSRKFYKRWRIPTERTRFDSLRMRSRHTRQHTRLHWGCLLTKLSLNIKLTGQSIWPTTKLAKKGSSSCKNWRSSAWKHMRTLGPISKREGVPSWPKSACVQISLKAHRKYRSRWDGPFVITKVFPMVQLNYRMKLQTAPSRSNTDNGRDGEHLINGTNHTE